MLDRFFDKIDIKEKNECWIWKACKTKRGYGRFGLNGYTYFSHRIMWELENSCEIPDGKVIMHTCDNPSCVNPNHLLLGTQEENNNDCLIKGRWKIPKSSLGTENGMSKLTEDDIKKIYNLLFDENFTYKQICEKFNICKMHVYRIKSGKRWKHLFKERFMNERR